MTTESTIPAEYLKKLTECGLWHSKPMGCFGGGVWIVKPSSSKGNKIPDYEPSGLVFIDDGGEAVPEQPDSDAPMLSLSPDTQDNKWVVLGVDGVGGMSAADFVTIWDTLDEAIEDIKDFYFGDPTRMSAKAAYRLDPRGETEKAEREGRMPKWPWTKE
ncbi:MAG: hypothetical protein JST89_12090 [Cyanobacteria bacterium SZAS-4]|nr:hypothetical protein [Cyanobacteria bacterium SZAS-4]